MALYKRESDESMQAARLIALAVIHDRSVGQDAIAEVQLELPLQPRRGLDAVLRALQDPTFDQTPDPKTRTGNPPNNPPKPAG